LTFGSGDLTVVVDGAVENVTGSTGNDSLTVNAGTTSLAFTSNGGNDQITLAAGTNTVTITADTAGKAVTVTGNTGADTVTLTGSSILSFTTGGGDDKVTGGSGNDRFVFGGGITTADTIAGGGGTTDTIVASNSGTYQLHAVSTVEVLQLGDGTANGDYVISNVPTGLTSITGDSQNNNVTIQGATSELTIDLGDNNDTLVLSSSVNNITVINAETINGAGGNDTITLQGNTNAVLFGNSGVDLLTGGNGNDVIFGLGGADTIYGGSGNDTIRGGTGADVLSGGSGCDVFVIATANGEVGLTSMDTIISWESGNDSLVFYGLNSMATGNVDRSLMGSAVDVTLAGTLIEAVNLASSASSSTVGTLGTNSAVVKWFQYDTNTYVVFDASTSTIFVEGVDQVVKITGTVSLTGANIGSPNGGP
jgi:Ca2+-binding RTX toxin-like protein